MEAIEYLLNNIDPKYNIYAFKMPILTTTDDTTPFKLNGKVYCAGKWDYKNQYYKIIAIESIDGAITYGLPNAITTLIEHPQLYNTVKWISDKLFISMLDNAEQSQTKTELVRLRIASNLIGNIDYLSPDARNNWMRWVQELYWERKKVLHKWYLEFILPF